MNAAFKVSLPNGYFLSDIVAADIPRYVQVLADRTISENLLQVPWPYSEKDAVWWVNHVNSTRGKDGMAIHWAIRNREGLLVGAAGFHSLVQGKSHAAEIGYWLIREEWGKGLMAHAIREVCRIGWEHFALQRISANIFVHNVRSERVLQKCGFVCEGVLRRCYRKDGRIFDGKVYALLAEPAP